MKLQLLTFLMLISAFCSAQKRVIVEKFTNAYCGACPNATIILEGYQETYPGLIIVKHHKPVTWTDNPLPNPASAILRTDVGVWGQPLAMINRKADGDKLVFSSGSWEDRVKAQLDEPHYVNLDFKSPRFDKTSRTLEFDVEMTFDELPVVEELRLSVLVIEDKVYGVEQHNYSNDISGHPLEGKGDIIWGYQHNAVTRMILDEPWGTDTAFPSQLEIGIPYKQSFAYVVPEEYAVQNMKIVALVAEHNEGNVSERTILNADEYILNQEIELLSASEELVEFNFQLSPNPAVDVIELQFEIEPSAIYIFDSLGQEISEILSPSRTLKIPISGLVNGNYNVVIESKDGMLHGSRFSKI